MKKLILVVMVTAMMPILGAAQGEEPRTILPASDFQLERLKGQVVFLDFWASWCEPCKKSMPWLSRMQEQYGDQGFQVVAVNLDSKLAPATKMLESLHLDIQVVHDPKGELAGKYELGGMPCSFLYDRGGKLIASHVGFLSSECGDKEEQFRRLLAKEKTDAKD